MTQVGTVEADQLEPAFTVGSRRNDRPDPPGKAFLSSRYTDASAMMPSEVSRARTSTGLLKVSRAAALRPGPPGEVGKHRTGSAHQAARAVPRDLGVPVAAVTSTPLGNTSFIIPGCGESPSARHRRNQGTPRSPSAVPRAEQHHGQAAGRTGSGSELLAYQSPSDELPGLRERRAQRICRIDIAAGDRLPETPGTALSDVRCPAGASRRHHCAPPREDQMPVREPGVNLLHHGGSPAPSPVSPGRRARSASRETNSSRPPAGVQSGGGLVVEQKQFRDRSHQRPRGINTRFPLPPSATGSRRMRL